MTRLIDPEASDVRVAGAFGTRWRAERERLQEQLMPSGQVVVSCPAPFGAGGLGRHLKELADAIDRNGPPAICMCGRARGHMAPSESPLHHELDVSGPAASLSRLTRFSPAWNSLRQSVAFDGCAARRLPSAEHLIAFNGQALKQIAAARDAQYSSVSLLSANSHLRRVVRQHAKAHSRYPLEGSWAKRLVRRSVKEYDRVDHIYVGSRYTWESFVEEGHPESRLSLFPFLPDPRFQADRERPRQETFDVVFVGRLSVDKGVPLLVDAFRQLDHADLRLILVGGWSSRGMRRFLQEATTRDPRISVGPGDPLPHLRRARLCAHPSYEDGFAYAPAEALACGVPALVSEDTGMKDLIDPGVNGLVLATGDRAALSEAIDAAYRGEILA
jgi:glycosyltransferase involved in cell wall biosynthesis